MLCDDCNSTDDVRLTDGDDGESVPLCRRCRGDEEEPDSTTEFDYGSVSARDVAEDDWL